MDHPFAVGDQVRTTKPLPDSAADHRGTVVRVYPATPGFYEVQLDGECYVRIVTADSIVAVQRTGRAEEAYTTRSDDASAGA